MAESLRIRFLDVGQGDAVVGILPGGNRAVVVDVNDADSVLNFIEAECIREVVLFITHSHADHTRGVESLLTALGDESRPADLIAAYCGQDRQESTRGYKNLMSLLGNAMRRLSRTQPQVPSGDFNTQLNHLQGFRDLFGCVAVTIVHPAFADRLNLTQVAPNETAGVLLLEMPVSDGSTRRALLTADVQLTGISLMLARDPSLVRSDVVQYPHHGAWPVDWPGLEGIEPKVAKKTMHDFLGAVMPSHIVFSVGRNNRFNHIRPETIAAVDSHYRLHRKLRSVCWTQTTANCCNPSIMPIDGPLATVSGSGDIEVLLSPDANTSISLTTYLGASR